MSMDNEKHRSGVAEYYGQILRSSADLRTSACCPSDAMPMEHRKILCKLHPEVVSRFYGCGSPLPSNLKNATVLDLGSGTGRDAYLASALVGPEGKVIGVDMTDEQLDIANKYKSFHADILLGTGIPSNVEFRKGIIENLSAVDISDESIDVVISNCVCNLCPDKEQVWREVYRVLKEGGEFYFSDVYADRRLTPEAASNEILIGECLGGALYIEDFRRVMASVGFIDVRVVSCAPVSIHDPELIKLVPDVTFFSITVRAFKVSGLEDRRENYQQNAIYKGCCSDGLRLDVDYSFPNGVSVAVDKNTALILQSSRFSKFMVVSSPGNHLGIFRQEASSTLSCDKVQWALNKSKLCNGSKEDNAAMILSEYVSKENREHDAIKTGGNSACC